MRNAVLLVLAVGCSDATELRVTVSSTRVDVDAYDPMCRCDRQAPPSAGLCIRVDDVRNGNECNCLTHCVSGLRIERDGDLVATGPGSSINGDFLGTTLVVRGCGEDVVVPLPASTPPLPTIHSITGGGGRVQLTWTSPPPVDLVEVRSEGITGERCFVPPESSTTTINGTVGIGGSPSLSVTAMQVLPVLESENGIVRMFATASVDGSSIH
jgi:hypothetical protein